MGYPTYSNSEDFSGLSEVSGKGELYNNTTARLLVTESRWIYRFVLFSSSSQGVHAPSDSDELPNSRR